MLVTSGSPTEIWLQPEVWISGWETPSWSTRWRMMSTARLSEVWLTGALRGRLGLVDELDAALEVEAQERLLGGDHRHRRGDQAEHEQQDEAVALTI